MWYKSTPFCTKAEAKQCLNRETKVRDPHLLHSLSKLIVNKTVSTPIRFEKT